MAKAFALLLAFAVAATLHFATTRDAAADDGLLSGVTDTVSDLTGGEGSGGESALGGVLDDTLEDTTGALTETLDNTTKTVNDTLETTGSAVEKTLGGNASQTSDDSGAVLSEDTSLENTTQPLSHTVASVTQPVAGAVAPVSQDLGETVATVLEPAGAALAPVTEALAPTLEAAAGPLVETVATTIEPLTESLAPVTEPLLETLQPVVEPVLELAATATQPLFEAIEPLVAPVLEVVEPVLEPILEIVDPIVEPITEIVQPVLPIGDGVDLPVANPPLVDPALPGGALVPSSPIITLPSVQALSAFAAAEASWLGFDVPGPASRALSDAASGVVPDAMPGAPGLIQPLGQPFSLADRVIVPVAATSSSEAVLGVSAGEAGSQAPPVTARAEAAQGAADSGGSSRVPAPPMASLAALLALFLAGYAVKLFVTEVAPRSWQFQLTTPPA